jgi:uncharacterized membrane protein YjfL (UPF0719 family)
MVRLFFKYFRNYFIFPNLFEKIENQEVAKAAIFVGYSFS